jgi:hypothetical protein
VAEKRRQDLTSASTTLAQSYQPTCVMGASVGLVGTPWLGIAKRRYTQAAVHLSGGTFKDEEGCKAERIRAHEPLCHCVCGDGILA